MTRCYRFYDMDQIAVALHVRDSLLDIGVCAPIGCTIQPG